MLSLLQRGLFQLSCQRSEGRISVGKWTKTATLWSNLACYNIMWEKGGNVVKVMCTNNFEMCLRNSLCAVALFCRWFTQWKHRIIWHIWRNCWLTMQLFVLTRCVSCYHRCYLCLMHQNCSKAVLGSGGSANRQSSLWLKSCMGGETAEASTVVREPGQELFFPSPFLTWR